MKLKSFLISCFLLTAAFSVLPSPAQAQKKSQIKQAEKLSAEGDFNLRRKDYKTAVGKFSEAIALLPSLAPAHFGKANAHIELNENDKAVAELDAALAGGYKPLEVYRLRWRLYFAQKNYDAALADALKAADSDPKNAAYFQAFGEIYLARNSFQDALLNFQKFAQTNPKDADVYYFIAAAYDGLKDAEQTAAAAEEAVKRNTKYAGESYFLIAEVKRENKNYAEAVDFYRRATAVKPAVNIAAYRNLSEIYRRQNRFKEAIETTQKGLQNFPDDVKLVLDEGRFYNLADRNAEAIAAAEKAARLLPEDGAARALLCRVYYETKQIAQAQKACADALESNPNDGASNVYNGFINLSLGRDEIAKTSFVKAVDEMLEYTKANPVYFDGFFLLGNSFYYAGQPKKAIEAYLKTLELNPNFTRARFNLGLTYFVAGNLPAARAQYDALLVTNKDLAEKLKATIDKK